jgi:hypothetical protein
MRCLPHRGQSRGSAAKLKLTERAAFGVTHRDTGGANGNRSSCALRSTIVANWGADVGKAFNLGSHAMGFQVGAYELAKRPCGAPQWIIRVQLTAVFPTGW